MISCDVIGASLEIWIMASNKQRASARTNIKKAAAAAKKKRTIAHLSPGVRTALGKKGAAAARKKRSGG
jgi:hypothetical protein